MALTSPFSNFSSVPSATGLYDPRNERDACGLAMVATLRGTAGHDIIDVALGALRNLEHRGAVGSDAGTGDAVSTSESSTSGYVSSDSTARGSTHSRPGT